MPGTLFVVATPIGNLEDITLRALRILKEVAVVAAEDTRRSGNLLRHYDIATPLVSLHAHNEFKRLPELIHRLRRGDSVAVVSDAGTPGIADPGADLVAAAREAGIRIEPVPGASAVAAALSVTGWSASRFAFGGFVPIKAKDRNNWFDWVRNQPEDPIVFFEAPHRVVATVRDIESYLVDRPILLGREVTKLHETWLSGTAGDVLAQLGQPQGEYVGVIGPVVAGSSEDRQVPDAEIASLFGQLTENYAGTRRDTVKEAARRLGLSARTVYAALERHKKSVN
jgi:16S rRNA (cytidine1402-2'-O)-methyltransferase